MMCCTGDHTRSISQAKVSQLAGGIMSFAKVRPKCLGCKAQLEGAAVDLCKHCRPRVRPQWQAGSEISVRSGA